MGAESNPPRSRGPDRAEDGLVDAPDPGASDVEGTLARYDVERYLAHLGVPAPEVPTTAALTDLVRAHVGRVPFENVLIQLGRPAVLRPATTVARIVRGGGGYCFELGGAFGALLTTLGFDVRRHEGRCWIGAPDPPDAPVNHLALTVGCADGSRWFVEVGMSDAVCEPIPLKPGRVDHGPFSYGLEEVAGPRGAGWRFRHDPHGSFGGMDFSTARARPAVVEAAHRRLSTAPDSPFTRLLSVGRRDRGGADVLRGRVLIRWDEAGSTRTDCTDADEWFALLATFGLPTDDLDAADREELWTRVCAAHAAWEETQR